MAHRRYHAARKAFSGAAVLGLLAAGALSAQESVDINTAGPEELAETLNGVGSVRAQAIIEERRANGPFDSAEDLERVSGVGPSTVEGNRERIRADEPE